MLTFKEATLVRATRAEYVTTALENGVVHYLVNSEVHGTKMKRDFILLNILSYIDNPWIIRNKKDLACFTRLLFS